jgi:hypothetical protein
MRSIYELGLEFRQGNVIVQSDNFGKVQAALRSQAESAEANRHMMASDYARQSLEDNFGHLRQ